MSVLLLTVLLASASWAELHTGLSTSYGAPAPPLGGFSGENIGSSLSVSSSGHAGLDGFTNGQVGFAGESSRESFGLNSNERFAGGNNGFLQSRTSGVSHFGRTNSVSGSSNSLYNGVPSLPQGTSNGFSNFGHIESSGFSNEVQGVSSARNGGRSYNGASSSSQRQSGRFSSGSFGSLSGFSGNNGRALTGRRRGSSSTRQGAGSTGSSNVFSSDSLEVSSGFQRGGSGRLAGGSYNGASFDNQGRSSGTLTGGFLTSSQNTLLGSPSGTQFDDDSSRERGSANRYSSGIMNGILISSTPLSQSSNGIVASSHQSFGSLPLSSSASLSRSSSGRGSYQGRASGSSQSSFQGRSSGSGFSNGFISSGQSAGGFRGRVGTGAGSRGGGSLARYSEAQSSSASFTLGTQGARGPAGFANTARGQSAPAPGYSAPSLRFSSGSREQSFASPGRLVPTSGQRGFSSGQSAVGRGHSTGRQGVLSSASAASGSYGSRRRPSVGQNGSSSNLQIFSSIGGRVNIPGLGGHYQ